MSRTRPALYRDLQKGRRMPRRLIIEMSRSFPIAVPVARILPIEVPPGSLATRSARSIVPTPLVPSVCPTGHGPRPSTARVRRGPRTELVDPLPSSAKYGHEPIGDIWRFGQPKSTDGPFLESVDDDLWLGAKFATFREIIAEASH